MSICPKCGNDYDPDNDTQPMCTYCGYFPGVDDHIDDSPVSAEWNDPSLNKYASHKDPVTTALTTQDIFRLRKEKKFDEALAGARKLYQSDPDDEWVVRALAWSLHSKIKELQNGPERDQYVSEFLELTKDLDESDEILANARMRMQDPVARELEQIRHHAREGGRGNSLRALRRLHEQHPEHVGVNESLAWEIWRTLIEILKRENPTTDDCLPLLREYGRLNVSQPSDIHTRMLEAAARAAKKECFPTFCRFLRWWNPVNLRDEDFRGRTGRDGNRFPSVVEQVIGGLGKVVDELNDSDDCQFAADFIHEYSGNFPDQEWFPYYEAKALVGAGLPDDARKLLVPVVRRKSGEFWAWQHLAETWPKQSDSRLHCLAKAVRCKIQKDEFLLGVRLALAEELILHNHLPEARHQLQTIIRVREQNGWEPKGRLLELISEEWFGSATPSDEGSEQLAKWATRAEELLFADLPWQQAVVTDLDVKLPHKDKPYAFLEVELPRNTFVNVRVTMDSLASLMPLQPGDPLEIKLSQDGERYHVQLIRERKGESWDILPRQVGLVASVNREKGVTAILLETGETALLFHDKKPVTRKMQVGSLLICRTRSGKNRPRIQLLDDINLEFKDGECWHMFEGEFEPREQGGGHVDGIFVSGELARNAQSREILKGIAVMETSRDGQHWWKAIAIDFGHGSNG